MQETIQLLGSIVQQTTFDAGRLGTFSPSQLRALYHSEKVHGGLSAAAAKANVPEDSLEALVQKLRPLLSIYIDPETDRIGNGLVDLMGGSPRPEIAELARILVRAAATLGPERVVQLVFGWIEGEPLHYRTKVLLSGISTDQSSLELEEGIRIQRLPNSSAELPAHVPAFSLSFHGFEDFMNGVVLSIDCKAGPALYAPPKSGALQSNIQHTWAHGKIPPYSLDTFCEALSLACNHCVRWKFHWNDFGDLLEFNRGVFAGLGYSGFPRTWEGPGLSKEHLRQALGIRCKLASSQKNQGLSMAISRWANSKRPESTLPDQFIDLRIALEALYLADNKGKKLKFQGEMRFRLATYGAWHLGVDLAERSKHHKTLREAYALASSAVHSGAVENTPKNRELLATAQDLCRNGILKRLKEARPPDWNEIILGAGSN